MNIIILTNDNYFSFKVLRKFLNEKKDDVKLIVFSSALIGKKSTFESVKWAYKNTGFRHTVFKLSVYGFFKVMKTACKMLPFMKNKYSSLLWAKRNNMNYIISPNVNSEEVLEKVKSCDPDLIVSVSMNQIVKKTLLEMPSKKSINVHCAPLPKYAGMSPYVWALANNEDHSAATIHYMEEGLDEGDIIIQNKIPAKPGGSAFDLFKRCCEKASQQLQKVVEDIETDNVSSYKQDISQKTYYSWPTKECVENLYKNGYKLAKMYDFVTAVLEE